MLRRGVFFGNRASVLAMGNGFVMIEVRAINRGTHRTRGNNTDTRFISACSAFSVVNGVAKQACQPERGAD